MTCHDCPNATDGKCCHQLIRPQGSKTMNLLDDRANDEADRHSQMMQSQKKAKVISEVNLTSTVSKKTPKEKEGVYKFDKEHTSWNSNDRRKGF